MVNKSKANRRKSPTSKTYNRKLDKLKKWYTKREEARKTWTQERQDKTKPLKPLSWYVEQLKQAGKEVAKKATTSLTKRTWY